MKKISKASLFIAVSAMAAVSCAKENIGTPSSEGVAVHFSTAELSTKSHFGELADGKYPTLWSAGQTVAVIYSGNNSTTPTKVDVTPSEDSKTASFTKEFEMSSTASAHNFYIVSPGESAIGFPNGNYNLQIPTTQTPLDGSCDEAAQVTVASHVSETFDTEINGLQFSHVTAYGRMSVVLPDDAGEVSSIALTASKNFSGRWFYSFEDGSLKENSASATITLNTSKTSDIFFGCAPVDLTGGTLEVVVMAANGTYEKTIDFSSAAKPLKLEAGIVSAFSVADFTKKANDEVYTLVTDASTLKIGDKVIIAAAESDYAISTTQNNNNRAQTSITKTGNTIVNPGNDVQLFTLEAGSTDGTYAFNTGSGYIYAASNSKNYLKTQNNVDANASWTITFSDEGVLTIKAAGTNTKNIIRYNSSAEVFSCYSSGQAAVAIYTDGKGTGSLPTPPSIVLSSTEVSLTYDDETTHEDITATVSGQEGDVECAAYDDKAGTTESSWLIASYENGKVIYYSASKNETDSPRTAYIIISATNSDGTTTKAITVTQQIISKTIFEESFSSDQGNFKIEDVTLPTGSTYVWKWDKNKYMKASSYVNDKYLASESLLISPEIDLSGETSAVLTFSHALNFLKGNTASDFISLVVRKSGDESWQNLTIPDCPAGTDWTFVDSGEIDLKDYLGSKIQFAFKYESTTSCAPTWEIKNVKVERK